MAPLCDPILTYPLPKPPFPLHLPSFPFSPSPSFPHKLNFTLKPHNPPSLRPLIAVASAAASEIDMVKNRQGIYTSKKSKVVVLWDLDNKPPRGPPYPAAVALKKLAESFGEVVEISAYANRHAFSHLPHWVMAERRERKQLDILERKGIVAPPEPYVCGVCGRKLKTNLELKRHFKQLHERERQKKLNRMRSLKGKKRQKYKERFISGNFKYNEEARRLVTPKVGYGLAGELRRAGVYVKTVEDKPQAADWALKRQIEHSMSRGVDWLFLISDDSDFSEILRRAREANLGTVVVGDRDRALGRHADYWVPWIAVENGEVTERDLVRKEREIGGFEGDDGFYSVSGFDDDLDGEESEIDRVIGELAGSRSRWNGLSVSGFSEGEDEGEGGDYLVWESEDEDEEDDDDDEHGEGDYFL